MKCFYCNHLVTLACDELAFNSITLFVLPFPISSVVVDLTVMLCFVQSSEFVFVETRQPEEPTAILRQFQLHHRESKNEGIVTVKMSTVLQYTRM